MTTVHGACLCGVVRYGVGAPYRWFAHCHCSMCRKHHGALFSTGVGVTREHFGWLAGASEIVPYRATQAFERPFCGRCGSKVPAASHMPDVLNVPAGNLEGDLGARPDKHIFAAARSASVRINDALPQFEAYPPRTRLRGVERPREAATPGVMRGSCLCGSIAYEIEGTLNGAVNCHCSRCRRSRGTPFATHSLVPAERLRFTEGEQLLRDYRLPGPARYGTRFCARCGSLLPSVIAGIGATVPIGTLDVDTEVPVLAHIFVASKALWHDITDTVPQYPEYPPPDVVRQLV